MFTAKLARRNQINDGESVLEVKAASGFNPYTEFPVSYHLFRVMNSSCEMLKCLLIILLIHDHGTVPYK